MKTGIDIIEIDRFNLVNAKKFIEKYFTDEEIKYVIEKKNMLESIAGIFACKEAILKAFKVGIGKGISLKEIEVGHVLNVPYVVENETILKLMKQQNITDVDVSISHSENYAVAICIIN